MWDKWAYLVFAVVELSFEIIHSDNSKYKVKY